MRSLVELTMWCTCDGGRVRCAKRGGVRFTVGGNPWFLMVLIHNVGGAGNVVAVRIKCPYTGWVPMYRNWGALWTVRTKMSGPLSFVVTTSDRRSLVLRNVVRNGWRFGQTWAMKARCGGSGAGTRGSWEVMMKRRWTLLV
nr:expansin-A11-like [Physcomitrium patens]|eukprot:XP_024364479.1 expansin-A11-like [Physcomitrella patens]